MSEEAHAPNPGSEPRPLQSRADAGPAAAADLASPASAPAATSLTGPKSSKPSEKAAKTPTDLKSLNVRQYLEATVVAVLMKGMQEVVKERPEDPLDYLAQYLIRHNPKKHVSTADGAKE